MGKLSSLLFGAALGAGLMYYLDPSQRERRKAMIRDQANGVPSSLNRGLDIAVRDLRHRIYGTLSEAAAMFSDEGSNDPIITGRIRSRLGSLTRHPGAVQIDVRDKQAVITGDILADEVENLMAGLQKVRGVMGVDNKLRVHQTADNIPQLQGEGQLPVDNHQWSPGIRLVAGTGAAYLLLYGMLRGGFMGTLAQIGGVALGTRAVANKNLKQLAGLGQEGEGIHVRKSININAPVEQVYSLWANFENFPQFMSNVESINDLGNGRSHWVVKGPAGTKVEFDAITTEAKPNELVAWETVEDSTVKHRGEVRFKNQKDNTQVNINMAYTPPAGVVGHAVASIFGVDPKSSMDEDLARMKTLLEVGKTSAKGKTVTPEKVMNSGKRNQIPQTGKAEKNQQDEKQPGMDDPSGQTNQGGMIPNTGDMDRSEDLGSGDEVVDVIIIEETTTPLIPQTGMIRNDFLTDEGDLMDEEDELKDDNDMSDEGTNSDPFRDL